jgi:hypothetical protein
VWIAIVMVFLNLRMPRATSSLLRRRWAKARPGRPRSSDAISVSLICRLIPYSVVTVLREQQERPPQVNDPTPLVIDRRPACSPRADNLAARSICGLRVNVLIAPA